MEALVQPSETPLRNASLDAKQRGDRLWAAMAENGCSYTALADRTGINSATIWRIRHGLTLSPRPVTIDTLAAELDVDSLWLMEGTTLPPGSERRR